jgi:3-mercaptopyruvate sulfurtransferase SseA
VTPVLHPTPADIRWRQDLVRWRQLVTPAWLAALAAGRAVSAAPGAGWRLLEVGCGGAPHYARGHIPGAGYLDTADLEAPPFWNKASDAALLRALLAQGIRHDSTVVLYSRGSLAAARAAQLMLYAGVADVRLLDGGFAAWERAGLPLARGAAPPHPVQRAFGAPFPLHPEYLIGSDAARALLARPDGALVSIRTWDEFVGVTSGYSYIAARGDIPGARWGRAGSGRDVDSMSDFQDAEGCMRPAAEIRALWQACGIHAGQQAAFYCGTGWRASLAFFYAWLMDWKRISVYDGGWCEWSADPANPVLCRVAAMAPQAEAEPQPS